MEKGYLTLILHAHLPFVRHPEHEYFLEEDWLYEAITETYIPILDVFEKLTEDSVDFRLTISLSPPLVEMFNDELLRERYDRHLNKLLELSYKEIERNRKDAAFEPLAKMYNERLKRAKYLYEEKYKRDLTGAFKYFQDIGKIEITTCGATHGFLPNLSVNPKAVRAQVQVAVDSYKRNFGRQPRGIWLPECGYYPGLDIILKEAGIDFFILENHALIYGKPRPRYGVYMPVYCPSGVAVFGRDIDSSKQVWSSEEGYPGDYNYREFYRDVGFDLPLDYVMPYIHPDGIRINTGIKYYRITGKVPLGKKAPYIRKLAVEKAIEHAGNFMFNRERQIEYWHDTLKIRPIIVAPYDAELFGHWWFEGPEWLEYLIRKSVYDQKVFKLVTPSDYLERYSNLQVTQPTMSSWGWKGYSEVWLNGSNDWIYRHLHKAVQRMTELARENPDARGLRLRALNQAARELLLAQSSDWAFIMKTETAVQYAVRRTKEHITNFNTLYDGIKNDFIDKQWLAEIESRNNIFSEIDYRVYA